MHTDHTYAILRATGFPLPAPSLPRPPSALEAAHAALLVLDAPLARMVEAATMALLYAAAHGLEKLPETSAHATRRAAFLLESLQGSAALPPPLRAAVQRLELPTLASEPGDELPLSQSMSRGLLRRFKEARLPLCERWGVYGQLELRPDLLDLLPEPVLA